jgi:hypothetical protein
MGNRTDLSRTPRRQFARPANPMTSRVLAALFPLPRRPVPIRRDSDARDHSSRLRRR